MDIPLLAGLRTDGSPDAAIASRVARAWLSGGIVGLPTETVYGLAADAQDASAVARVYQAKGRPADHPLIVHVQGAQALAGWCAEPNPVAERLVSAFWPGALTVVVARNDRAGDFITGGQDTVALRCPDHPVARACLEALGRLSGDPARGVAAPSANRFGRVSPTRAGDVLAEVGASMDAARDLVVDGGACAIGVESTIVDCTAAPPRVLRLGAISQEQIDAVLAGDEAGAVTAGDGEPRRRGSAAGRSDAPEPAESGRESAGSGPETDLTEQESAESGREGAESGDVRAPGSLESHYAPLAAVLLVEPHRAGPADLGVLVEPAHAPARRDPFGLGTLEGSERARIMDGDPGSLPSIGLVAPVGVATPDSWTRLTAPTSAEEYARGLYAALRRADELRLDLVVAVLPDPTGGPLSLAVRDRLARAAHGGGA